MKALTRTVLVVLLVYLALSSRRHAFCGVETRFPYEFDSGLVNVIRFSENPETPLWVKYDNDFPTIEVNYTVQQDGWLEISTYLLNGSRPELMLNGEPVYRTLNPFYSGQVYSGDFYELLLTPPEHMNNTFSIEQDDTILTVYELYTWDSMIGELIFKESPRQEVDAGFSWNPIWPVEGGCVVFSPTGLHEGDTVHWNLTGPGIVVEDSYTHFVTDPLAAGEYIVSLFVEDIFGYNHTETMTFIVKPSDTTLLMDPDLTSVSILDVSYPSLIEVNQITDVTVSVAFDAPVSREIRVSVVDQTGDTLTSVLDQVVGEGSIDYSLSFESSGSDMSLKACVEFLHEDEWILGMHESFMLSIVTPVTMSNSVPGYSLFAVLLGLGLYLKRSVDE